MIFVSFSSFEVCSIFRMDHVPRQSYAKRYRNVREKYPGDTSPTRRTATIVRRVPDNAVVEGKSPRLLFIELFHSNFFSLSSSIIFPIVNERQKKQSINKIGT